MYYKIYLTGIALACLGVSAYSQSPLIGHLGWPSMPADDTPIDSLIYYGEDGDMSNGYQNGETVADFTVYDFEGNSITLSEKLTGDKPVIMISGSVSCSRFRDVFDLSNNFGNVAFTRQFITDYLDDFEWIFIYNVEAHPSDGECPSNCYDSTTLDTTVWQHPDYGYRRYAMRDWRDAELPHEFFPLDIYADNPDNGVYNHFFQRPFGMVVLTCDGRVAMRGDWTQIFIPQNHQQILDFKENYQACFTLPDDSNPIDGEDPIDDDPNEDEDPIDEQDPGDNDEDEEEEEDTSISVWENEVTPDVLFFPNPFSAELTLRTPESGQLVVRDVLGRVIGQFEVQPGKNAIPTAVWPAGLYFGTVYTSDGLTHTVRLEKN